jgi:hypothetical protein
VTAPASPPGPLRDAGPTVGQIVLVEHGEWAVVGRATYRNEGLHSEEWECRKGSETAYLLKETERGQVRWFFARQIALSAVALPSGASLDRRPRTDDGSPPPSLAFRGQTYRYETTTEGQYEERPGQAVGKTTWEYWDASRAYNLALERWPDGRLDAYHGAYVDAATIHVRPGRRASSVAIAALVAGLVYFFALVGGLPFDRCTGISLVLGGVVGLARALYHAPSAAAAALILTPALGVVFYRFPPLTTVPGLIALIVAPALMARWAGRAPAVPKGAVRSAAFFTTGLPLLVVGLYYYFTFAPGPHSVGQYALALGPAFLGGVGAAAIAGLVLKAAE